MKKKKKRKFNGVREFLFTHPTIFKCLLHLPVNHSSTLYILCHSSTLEKKIEEMNLFITQNKIFYGVDIRFKKKKWMIINMY